MSLASKVGQVVYQRKSGVYMPMLQCDKGDLYQEYQGDPQNPTNITPDFSTLLPTLSNIITSSRVADGLVIPNLVKWFFNDTELTFGSDNVSTNSFNGETGHFKSLPYQKGTRNYYGLQILKNLVKAAGAAPCTIKSEATVAVGNTSDKIQTVYGIPITEGTSNAIRVTIQAGDNKYFTLTTNNDSCILQGIARIGNDEIASGLTYKWYSLVSGVWKAISGQTAKNLTVTNDMVDSVGQFKVEIYQNGTLIGSDVQTVTDASDPLDIIPNPTPEDETIEEGSNGTVVYTPILVKRGETTKFKDMTFFFAFMDVAGIILNLENSETAAASGTVTEEMCQQASGNVAVVITTKE